jgi:hypothetical protein
MVTLTTPPWFGSVNAGGPTAKWPTPKIASMPGPAVVTRFVAFDRNKTNDPSAEITVADASASGSVPSGLTLIRVA